VAAAVAAVRAATDLPIALGFGIGTGAEAAAAGELADGVVVGSALVRRMAEGPAAVRGFMAELRRALDAAAVAP
jgi:tryptophan synthase alpha chain